MGPPHCREISKEMVTRCAESAKWVVNLQIKSWMHIKGLDFPGTEAVNKEWLHRSVTGLFIGMVRPTGLLEYSTILRRFIDLLVQYCSDKIYFYMLKIPFPYVYQCTGKPAMLQFQRVVRKRTWKHLKLMFWAQVLIESLHSVLFSSTSN